jgi:hypothetical protein
MSWQIIPLKDRTDLRESSRILALETIRVRGAALGIRSSGLGSAGIFSSVLHRRWPSCGAADKAQIGREPAVRRAQPHGAPRRIARRDARRAQDCGFPIAVEQCDRGAVAYRRSVGTKTVA